MTTAIADARLAKIASPFVQLTPIQEVINGNDFTLDESAVLLGFNRKATLAAWLSRHRVRLPIPRYRDVRIPGRGPRVQIRVLTVQEINAIRDMIRFGREDARYRYGHLANARAARSA